MQDNENISSDISSAAQKGVKAARGVSTITSAAGKAASGNYAGAALEILKSEETLRLVLVLLCILAVILIMVMYVLPMSVYEGLQTVVADAQESFSVAYYSGSGGNLFKAVWSFAETFFSSIWNSALGSARAFRDDGAVLDFYDDTDGDVVGIADAPGDSVYLKLQAAKEKYSLRRDTIRQEIKTQAHDAVYERALSDFSLSYDPGRDVFNGFVWDESGCTRDLSDILALKLMSLYAVINGNDFSRTRLSDYMKWLGYSSYDAPAYTLSVFGTDVYIDGFKGTFMPCSLVDEAREAAFRDGKDYQEVLASYADRYGTSAMDLMIKAYVSPALTSVCQRCVRYLPEYSGTFRYSAFLQNESLTGAVEKYRSPDEGYVYENIYDVTNYLYYRHSAGQYNRFYSDTEKQNHYASCHNGERMPLYWKDSGYEYLPETEQYISLSVYQYYESVTYTAYLNIVPRNDTLIVGLSGIISGNPSGGTE